MVSSVVLFLKDTFKLYQIIGGTKKPVPLDGKGIAWWTDYNIKNRNPSVTPLKNAFNGINCCSVCCISPSYDKTVTQRGCVRDLTWIIYVKYSHTELLNGYRVENILDRSIWNSFLRTFYNILLSGTVQPSNWPKPAYELDPTDPANNGFINQDFLVWMRRAALPNFRKLYRRIAEEDYAQGLPAGNYSLEIAYSILFNENMVFCLVWLQVEDSQLPH